MGGNLTGLFVGGPGAGAGGNVGGSVSVALASVPVAANGSSDRWAWRRRGRSCEGAVGRRSRRRSRQGLYRPCHRGTRRRCRWRYHRSCDRWPWRGRRHAQGRRDRRPWIGGARIRGLAIGGLGVGGQDVEGGAHLADHVPHRARRSFPGRRVSGLQSDQGPAGRLDDRRDQLRARPRRRADRADQHRQEHPKATRVLPFFNKNFSK